MGEQTNSDMSNEDRLFMSQTMSYPGQGSFTLTVQAGQGTSWRPNNLQPMDSLANAMMNMDVQDENEQLQQPQQHWTVVQQREPINSNHICDNSFHFLNYFI